MGWDGMERDGVMGWGYGMGLWDGTDCIQAHQGHTRDEMSVARAVKLDRMKEQ